MPRMARIKRMKALITLPDELVDELDELAEEADCSRGEVVEALLGYCFEHQEIIDEVFPEETEEEEEEEAEEAESEA
jgi:metal-responsive CopG/Arc/MetJ family transcriptional regulator